MNTRDFHIRFNTVNKFQAMQNLHGNHAIFASCESENPGLSAVHNNNDTHQHPKAEDTDMAAFDTTRPAYGSIGLVGRIGTFFASIIASYTAWNDSRITRKALSKLSDRELEDIGLVRGDIDVVADGKTSY